MKKNSSRRVFLIALAIVLVAIIFVFFFELGEKFGTALAQIIQDWRAYSDCTAKVSYR